jgi:hypothetical protein
MTRAIRTILALIPLLSALPIAANTGQLSPCPDQPEAAEVTAHEDGLHGYISYNTQPNPDKAASSAGIGFYSAVWPLIDQPLAGFQIGLPGCWILPDNKDNRDHPLAPEGTLARTWKERGPTWDSVFQTVEGGLGYWAGNHFRYSGPKFSMNATPQCYDYEVGSPGWSFFYNDKALPDNRLGIAQFSNRLLIPPDGLPFDDSHEGQFLGYAWLALPFTTPTAEDDPPTGDQSWTCFLNAANFKGPIAFYVPQTWSKIGALFKDPFLYGRGLDARPGVVGGGAIEINTVPPETGLTTQKFRVAKKGATYITPTSAAWKTPGPATAPITVTLRDGSQVTYAWYRFIDQPVFQQYHWDDARKQRLQKLVAEIQAHWTIDQNYMPPPSAGAGKKVKERLADKIKLGYFVLDGHFGNHPACQMVRQWDMHLISKMRSDAALYLRPTTLQKQTTPQRKYGMDGHRRDPRAVLGDDDRDDGTRFNCPRLA